MPYDYMKSPKKEILSKMENNKDDDVEEKPLSVRDIFYAEKSDDRRFFAWLDG